jgi:hypothetical protein
MTFLYRDYTPEEREELSRSLTRYLGADAVVSRVGQGGGKRA